MLCALLMASLLAGLAVPAFSGASAPTNDNFAGALPIPISPAGIRTVVPDDGSVLSNTEATREPGEPNHSRPGGSPGNASLWFVWTAPIDGVAYFKAGRDSTGPDFFAAAYVGGSVDNLTRVGVNDGFDSYPFGYSYSSLSFDTVAGTTYHIAVDEDVDHPGLEPGATAKRGRVGATLLYVPRAPNGSFEEAEELFGTSFEVAGSSSGAVAEQGAVGEVDMARAAWYSWTAPKDGAAYMFFPGDETETDGAAVYTGNSIGELTRVDGQRALQDKSGDGRGSTNIFRAVSGKKYAFRVFGDAGAFGDADAARSFRMLFKLLSSPDNDDFSNARRLTGKSDSSEGTLVGATLEPLEPRIKPKGRPSETHASAWFSWRAPFSGPVSLAMCKRFNNRGLISVYVGDTFDNFERVTQRRSSVCNAEFSGEAGQQYWISVSDEYSPWEIERPPPNNFRYEARYRLDLDATVYKTKIGKVKVSGPVRIRKGKRATYKVTITNSGGNTAIGVRLKVNGRGISSNTSVGKIGAKKTRTVKVKVKPRRPGKIKTSFKVSSENAGGKSARKTIRVRK